MYIIIDLYIAVARRHADVMSRVLALPKVVDIEGEASRDQMT